jgi:hypothetical protein
MYPARGFRLHAVDNDDPTRSWAESTKGGPSFTTPMNPSISDSSQGKNQTERQSLVLQSLLYGAGGLGAYGADCLVDDDVEELIVVGSGFFLDDLAHALSGSGIVGQAEAALFS